MNKHLKRILIFLLVTALLLGGTYGGLTLYRNARTKPVKVYAASDFSETDFWMDEKETSGYVRPDNIQKIYLSETQTVTKVFVEEGQEIKKGDPLLSYDTTLSELDVEKADISLQKKKMEREEQIRFSENLNNARITEDLEAMEKSLEEQIKAAYDSMPEPTYPEIPRGKWTEEDPRYMENPGILDPEELLEESKKDHIYVVLCDGSDGDYYAYHGLEIIKAPESYFEETEVSEDLTSEETEKSEEKETEETETSQETKSSEEVKETVKTEKTEETEESEKKDAPEETEESEKKDDPADPEEEVVRFGFFDAAPLEPVYPDEPASIKNLENQLNYISGLMADSYSREELNNLKIETDKRIHDLELEIRIAEVELNKAKAEVGDGTVYADIDGVILKALPLQDMAYADEAVLVLSGGGGYYITGTVNEYDREKLKKGQEVMLSTYSGAYAVGTVQEIKDRPVEPEGWYGTDSNVSWYPFTVFADADNELEEGDWVNITYDLEQEEDQGSWYLEKFFIRSDNGRNYVYLQGEDGLLKKQYISTGKLIYEEYYEIRSGLDPEACIAFPYGKDVQEGAKTVKADPEELTDGFE